MTEPLKGDDASRFYFKATERLLGEKAMLRAEIAEKDKIIGKLMGLLGRNAECTRPPDLTWTAETCPIHDTDGNERAKPRTND